MKKYIILVFILWSLLQWKALCQSFEFSKNDIKAGRLKTNTRIASNEIIVAKSVNLSKLSDLLYLRSLDLQMLGDDDYYECGGDEYDRGIVMDKGTMKEESFEPFITELFKSLNVFKRIIKSTQLSDIRNEIDFGRNASSDKEVHSYLLLDTHIKWLGCNRYKFDFWVVYPIEGVDVVIYHASKVGNNPKLFAKRVIYPVVNNFLKWFEEMIQDENGKQEILDAVVLMESVKVNGKLWDVKNLNMDKFSNGDEIFYASNFEEWEMAFITNKPAWTYLDFNPKYNKEYGRIYNYHAVQDPRNLCPNEWRVANHTDWTQFVDSSEPTKAISVKSKTGWRTYREGNNSSGLNLLPGNYLHYHIDFNSDYDDNKYTYRFEFEDRDPPVHTRENSGWWALNHYLSLPDIGYFLVTSYSYSSYLNERSGLYVRCVKD